MSARDNFGHQTTTDEVLDEIDLSGKRVLVTGGASGLGAETVRALAARGAEVIIAARNKKHADEVMASVKQSTGNAAIGFVALELASLKKIETAAAEVCDRYDRLDLLINNAGIMACPFGHTEDGFELQFGSNHLGHFHFTNLIMPLLLAGAPARIVSLSSLGHRMSPVVFEDINYENRPYNKWEAYGQSKTANALFAVGLNARFADRGVEAFSVHPGVIQTRLGRHMSEDDLAFIMGQNRESEDEARMRTVKQVAQGAATSCYAATAPELDGRGGAYLEDCGIAEPVPDDSPARHGIRAYAVDPKTAERLWSVSEQMVGRQFG